MIRLTTFAAAGLIGLSAGGAATAQPLLTYTQRVYYGDLDLTSDRGAMAMLQRIRGATQNVCAQLNTPVLPRAPAMAWRCRIHVLGQSVAKLDSPNVTRQYARWHPEAAYALAEFPSPPP